MEKTLTLAVIALFVSAWITRRTASLLDSKAPTLPVGPKLFLVSISPPTAYVLFQTALFAGLGGLGKVFATSRGRHDVLIDPALSLWFFGGLCAVLMGIARYRSNQSGAVITSQASKILLAWILAVTAAALLLPIGMSDWIASGQTGPIFIVLALAVGLATGLLPVVGIAAVLNSRFGGAGIRRALLAAPVVAGTIGAGAFAWHQAVAEQPGAWTIWPVAAAALFGVVVGCGLIRQSLTTDGSDASAA